MHTVNTQDATAQWPELIASVRDRGEQIAITQHGAVVALLVPPFTRPASSSESFVAAVEHWRETRKGVTLNGLRVRDLIDERRP